MQEKTKKRISAIAIFAAVLAGILIQLFIPGLGVRSEAAEYMDQDITKTSARSDIMSMGQDKLSFMSDKDIIFIAMSQYYDLDHNLRTYIYLNFPLSIYDDLKVSLSTSVSDDNYEINEVFKDYELKLIDNDNQCNWCKFEVLGLSNLDVSTRRYNLSNLKQGEITLLEIDNVYIFNGISNDSIQVFRQEVETITITNKEVEFFCYGEAEDFGIFFEDLDTSMSYFNKYTDSFFIFFNTDKEIEDLLEIEIEFTEYKYGIMWETFCDMRFAHTEEMCSGVVSGTYNGLLSDSIDFDYEGHYFEKNEKATTTVIKPGKTTVSSSDSKWFGKYDTKYEEIDNIYDLRDYVSNGSSFEFKEQAQLYRWAVNFANYTKIGDNPSNLDWPYWGWMFVEGKGVTDTAILRLKFVTDGVVHNCYAVDVPTDEFSGNAATTDIDSTYDKLISVIFLVIIVVALGAAAPAIKPIIEGVVEIVKMPFSIIGSIFKNNKKK